MLAPACRCDRQQHGEDTATRVGDVTVHGLAAAFLRKERKAVAVVRWSRLGKERAARGVLSMASWFE